MRLVISPDTHLGHIVEDDGTGAVYQDDRTPVDDNKPRPCKGCGAHITPGAHDPCIANLPGTAMACCGHGVDRSLIHGKPAGYAALNDGRSIRFSGCLRGEGVREAVLALQQGLLLPDGFELDERAWWDGLTSAQRRWVEDNIRQGLAALVTELKGGEPPSERFLRGEALWFEELDDEKRALGYSRLRGMMNGLVQQALQHFPTGLIPTGPDISPNLPDDEPDTTAKPGGTTTAVTTGDGKATGEKKKKPAPASTGNAATSQTRPASCGGSKASVLAAPVPVAAGSL